ncbi:MAG TPA: helix-turn-helix transcriptional regulator [Microlunatus sp.]|nr:helix-turn-helix transcriptional regulator [Microlunatus sp.]
MSDEMSRVVDWLDDVLAWLREPLTEMPIERVLARLTLAFDVQCASWCRQYGTDLTEVVLRPADALLSESATLAEWQAGLHRDCHALTCWYVATPSSEPQTAGRVSSGVVRANRRAIIDRPLARLEMEQQMTIYYRRSGLRGAFFVVSRGRHDFDDQDLLLARYVQRSLVTLDRQTQVLRGREAASEVTGTRTDLDLTGRQLAVLQLLCDGLSTRQTARHLACSPRTVEKHLQHVYRKLEVRDRVNAMRLARLAGLVAEREPAGLDRSDTREAPSRRADPA